MPIKVPASEYMLPKSKDGWKSHTIMFFEKFLKQVPHFEGFFHIVILLNSLLNNPTFAYETKFPKKVCTSAHA